MADAMAADVDFEAQSEGTTRAQKKARFFFFSFAALRKLTSLSQTKPDCTFGDGTAACAACAAPEVARAVGIDAGLCDCLEAPGGPAVGGRTVSNAAETVRRVLGGGQPGLSVMR